jgi:hypothetical protein
MPDQFLKGQEFALGDQVTAQKLMDLVNKATLQVGSVTAQTAITTKTVAADDQIVAYDASATALVKIKAEDILQSNLPVTTVLVTTNAVTGVAGADTVITPAASQKVTVAGNINVTGTFTPVSINPTTESFGFSGPKALTIPVGDTANRPVTPVYGDFRYNTTINKVEIYNGTTWKDVGGSPFEASGGDLILEPESISSAATFATANGNDITVTVTAGHTCSVGQLITLTTATAGYTGDYIVLTISGINLTVRKSGTAGSIVSGQACTIQKTGNHKVHIFKNTGNFISTSLYDGEVDILVVGGGGGGDTGSEPKSGGGGGVVLKRGIKVTAGQNISVVVGSGGTSGGTGTNSSFGSIIAYGGLGGTGPSFSDWVTAESGGSTESASTGVTISIGNNNGTLLTFPYATQAGISNETILFRGIISDITNIATAYATGRGNPSNAKVNNTGNGGYYRGSNNDVFGSSGIVIVRYPYKLS